MECYRCEELVAEGLRGKLDLSHYCVDLGGLLCDTCANKIHCTECAYRNDCSMGGK